MKDQVCWEKVEKQEECLGGGSGLLCKACFISCYFVRIFLSDPYEVGDFTLPHCCHGYPVRLVPNCYHWGRGLETLKLDHKINPSSFKLYLSDVSHSNTKLDNTASSKSKSKRTSFGKNVVFRLGRKKSSRYLR